MAAGSVQQRWGGGVEVVEGWGELQLVTHARNSEKGCAENCVIKPNGAD